MALPAPFLLTEEPMSKAPQIGHTLRCTGCITQLSTGIACGVARGQRRSTLLLVEHLGLSGSPAALVLSPMDTSRETLPNGSNRPAHRLPVG